MDSWCNQVSIHFAGLANTKFSQKSFKLLNLVLAKFMVVKFQYRRALVVNYSLSEIIHALYGEVSAYTKEIVQLTKESLFIAWVIVRGTIVNHNFCMAFPQILIVVHCRPFKQYDHAYPLFRQCGNYSKDTCFFCSCSLVNSSLALSTSSRLASDLSSSVCKPHLY